MQCPFGVVGINYGPGDRVVIHFAHVRKIGPNQVEVRIRLQIRPLQHGIAGQRGGGHHVGNGDRGIKVIHRLRLATLLAQRRAEGVGLFGAARPDHRPLDRSEGAVGHGHIGRHRPRSQNQMNPAIFGCQIMRRQRRHGGRPPRCQHRPVDHQPGHPGIPVHQHVARANSRQAALTVAGRNRDQLDTDMAIRLPGGHQNQSHFIAIAAWHSVVNTWRSLGGTDDGGGNRVYQPGVGKGRARCLCIKDLHGNGIPYPIHIANRSRLPMDIDLDRLAPHGALEIPVLDMHTAGEPVRIFDGRTLDFGIRDGGILAYRRAFAERFDHLRRTMMHEPRGHAEMYGAILVPTSLPGSDAAVLFCHNSGYSTMCGHATIALGRLLRDASRASGEERDTFVLECPCGPVSIVVEADGKAGFDSVASFSDGLDEVCKLDGYGPIHYDIGYGGAYYAIVPASAAGLDLARDPVEAVSAFAAMLVTRLRATRAFVHPEASDLGFLYGAIVTDGVEPGEGAATRNLCWFGEGQIDRSPTGSGVSARLAVAAAKGLMGPGQSCRFAGASGHWFEGRITAVDGRMVNTHVSGRGHYAAVSRLLVEPSDPLPQGLMIAGRLPDQAIW